MVPCDCCKKLYHETSILRHIGQSEDCRIFYGPRFKEMKKKIFREERKIQKQSFKQGTEKGCEKEENSLCQLFRENERKTGKVP